jgi:hypothetical protein
MDDAGAVAERESGSGSSVDQLGGDVILAGTGPGQEPSGVVGESGKGAFAAVGEGCELGGTAGDDGGEVGGPAQAAAGWEPPVSAVAGVLVQGW